MKRILKIFILTVFLFNIVNISCFANSGPSYWQGSDATGVVMRENCPLTVEKEILTFDIYNQADFYSEHNEAEFTEYTDKFTAEYTFHNPTDVDITAQLAFPLGIMPHYVNLPRNMEKYIVSVDGKPIEKEIRYTKSDKDYEFDFNVELPKLIDGYMKDEFFSPDMTVTKYTLITHTDEEINHKRQLRIKLNGINPQVRRVLPIRIDSYTKRQGLGIQVTASIYNSHEPVLYVIGQPFDEFPEYGFYHSWEDNAKEVEATLEIKEETTTLENMLTELCKNQNTVWNVSPQDTYNMFISSRVTEDYYEREGIIHTEDIYFYDNNLLCWYLYEITVPTGETVTNTVTAPLYPAVELRYTPQKYRYTYLLSPAQQWARFEHLEININTPFYMLETNQDIFEKTETGYSYKGIGLPEGELEFVLCASENPQKEKASPYLLLIFLPIIGIIVLCAGFVILIIKLSVRKKNR